jgi:hypothetical protein
MTYRFGEVPVRHVIAVMPYLGRSLMGQLSDDLPSQELVDLLRERDIGRGSPAASKPPVSCAQRGSGVGCRLVMAAPSEASDQIVSLLPLHRLAGRSTRR